VSAVTTLLQAMVDANGDAVVLHTGDTPYVAGAGTEQEISPERLTLQAVNQVLEELVPEPSRRDFDLLGSIRYECPPLDAYPGVRFSVVALHEAEGLWLEIRRDESAPHPSGADDLSTSGLAAHPAAVPGRDDLAVPDFAALWPDQTRGEMLHVAPRSSPEPAPRGASPQQPLTSSAAEDPSTGPAWSDLSEFELDKLDDPLPPSRRPSAIHQEDSAPQRPIVTGIDTAAHSSASPDAPAPDIHDLAPRHTVLPSAARTPIRHGAAEPVADLTCGPLVRLLRIVAARGGSALYITSDARPSMRVDGEMRALDAEEPLSVADAETLLLAVMPKAAQEAFVKGERTEWISDVVDLGRVRSVSFRDRRGAGGIFRILNARPASVERLGLSREVQALALEREGLVLVAGPRSSGKSTLIATFVDLINRTRRDHVITIESEIQIVHESNGSVISQREVRGDLQHVLGAARGALSEDPDVLVIDEYRDDAMTHLALEAAGSGRLVIAGLPAHTTQDAVERVIDHFTPERRRHAQLALAENLRGIIAQSLLRRPGGGRLAAREVLLNTPAIAGLIADGRTAELPMAIEEGRKIGMMSLNESLAALVKNNAVDVREAYRCAGDRRGLLALLKRHGLDTTLVERLA
jgi:twitching motility protein PilT